MRIEAPSYLVEYDDAEHRVSFSGTLRLQGRSEYQEIFSLLMAAAEKSDQPLTLDLKDLRYLNSSGISSLSLFVVQMRKRSMPITIIGNATMSWQAKSIRNFERLHPQVELVMQ
jgi:hypothetical protein